MLSSALTTSRLGIAVLMAMVATFVAAAQAMAAPSTIDMGSNNALSYKAAAGQANDLTVLDDGATITVTDRGSEAISILNDQACRTTADPQVVTCTGANQIEVQLRDLDDTATLSTALVTSVSGQNGTDTLSGGSGLDMLKGGPGNDVLTGNDGNDVFFGEAGDDQMDGGDGIDRANYAATAGVTVSLATSLPQDTGDGMDSLAGIEDIYGSTTGTDVLVGNGGPNTFVGSGGDDIFDVSGGGSDVVVCGAGSDEVTLDRTDTVRYRFDAEHGTTCETIDDGAPPSNTRITSGPSGLTNDPKWSFTSDEPWASYECAFAPTAPELDTASWVPCRSGQSHAPSGQGDQVFGVRATDDQGSVDQAATQAFTLDTVAPDTEVQGPSGTISNPAPEFFLSSNDPAATFLCSFDRQFFFTCSSPVVPSPPLADGPHVLEVVAEDPATNRDATPARVDFTVNTRGSGPGPGDGPTPNPQTPVQQAKIIIGSLVLISGNAVKMSRKGRVSISLTCAGTATCKGRLSITTAEPVTKKSKKLVTLGAKKFQIAGNKKRRINVQFSKSKARLAKRLKRFKAKALIREIDSRGNPRISTRLFVLRAR